MIIRGLFAAEIWETSGRWSHVHIYENMCVYVKMEINYLEEGLNDSIGISYILRAFWLSC